MGEPGQNLLGERRTPSDDLVEGRLVEPGDSVFLSDRIVDPGARCGEGEDDSPPTIAVTARTAFEER
jgi:hypothetical protein